MVTVLCLCILILFTIVDQFSQSVANQKTDLSLTFLRLLINYAMQISSLSPTLLGSVKDLIRLVFPELKCPAPARRRRAATIMDVQTSLCKNHSSNPPKKQIFSHTAQALHNVCCRTSCVVDFHINRLAMLCICGKIKVSWNFFDFILGEREPSCLVLWQVSVVGFLIQIKGLRI